MNPTRACTVQDLGLMRLEDALKWISMNGLHDPYEVGELCKNVRRGFTIIRIPAKSYAVSVVDRCIENLLKGNPIDRADNILYISSLKSLAIDIYNDLSTMTTQYIIYCPTNPFEGLVNADGTPRTSATREEIEQWRREEMG